MAIGSGIFNNFSGSFDFRPSSKTVRARKSDKSLFAIWSNLQRNFFSHRVDLLEYEVIWSSRRQKRVLASITYRDKRVRVARELNHPDYVELLQPLLYHEMCHAVIGDGVEKIRGNRLWHGPKFKALESLHPASKALDHWIKSGGWLKAIRRDRARR
jgi:hypothetical protein